MQLQKKKRKSIITLIINLNQNTVASYGKKRFKSSSNLNNHVIKLHENKTQMKSFKTLKSSVHVNYIYCKKKKIEREPRLTTHKQKKWFSEHIT